MKACVLPHCGRPVHCRGWCAKHYNRWYRTGWTGSYGWRGSDQGVHAGCGGQLTGLIVRGGHRWAVCHKCGHRGEPVEVQS